MFVKTLKKIAELGVPLGQVHYGLLFQRGKKVPQDNNAAYYWMKKAADQDYPVALYNLGVYHEDGIGVPKSRSMAIYWYQKAAGKGEPQPQGGYSLHWGTSPFFPPRSSSREIFHSQRLRYFSCT